MFSLFKIEKIFGMLLKAFMKMVSIWFFLVSGFLVYSFSV